MIASALRTEIERTFLPAGGRALRLDALGGCAGALRRLASGHRVTAADEGAPSLRAMSLLLERAVAEPPAVRLAYRALCEYALAKLGADDESPHRFEAALDAIDDCAREPSDLPVLRERLRGFADLLEQTSLEAAHARSLHALHVSAA